MKKLNTTPVNYFDINRYLGLWYQIATIPSWFQRDMIRVTAEYSRKPDGSIKVDNIGYGRITGIKNRVVGTAERASSFYDSWLKVRFFFGKGDYFVLEIDPNYQWALVGSSDPDSLWILSRTPKIDLSLIDYLKDLARNRGYNVDKMKITQ